LNIVYMEKALYQMQYIIIIIFVFAWGPKWLKKIAALATINLVYRVL
jgi:hypothetical protein